MPSKRKQIHPSGVEDGTVLEIPEHGPINTPVKIRREVVIWEEDGTWHKEVVD